MSRKLIDSGVYWIGKIPEGWREAPLKYLIKTLESGGTPTSGRDDYYDDDGTCWVTISDMSSTQYVEDTIKKLSHAGLEDKRLTVYPIGTVLYSIYATIGKVSELKVPAAINQAILALSFTKDLCKGYAKLVLNAYEDYALAATSENTQKNLNAEKVRNIHFPLPPLAEQQRIAAFLDRECEKIDGLRGKIEKQIEKLDELKKSTITEAVTGKIGVGGRCRSRKMKPSGVEWIGDVPEEWKIYRGKFVLQLLARPILDSDGVITCFRDGEVTLRSKRREEGFTFADKECGYQGVEPGDLVVHGMDGFAGAIGISDSRGKASPVLNVLDTNEDKKFLMYYLRSMAYNSVFTAIASGIRVRSCDLRWSKLATLPYPIPPLSEQKEIAEYLDKKCAAIDAAKEKCRVQLEKLAEYKKSLIYEYVTGKREVA